MATLQLSKIHSRICIEQMKQGKASTDPNGEGLMIIKSHENKLLLKINSICEYQSEDFTASFDQCFIEPISMVTLSRSS